MDEFIARLRRMADEEAQGAKRYNQLSQLFYDMGMEKMAEWALDMALDERQHQRLLRHFIRAIEDQIGPKLKQAQAR